MTTKFDMDLSGEQMEHVLETIFKLNGKLTNFVEHGSAGGNPCAYIEAEEDDAINIVMAVYHYDRREAQDHLGLDITSSVDPTISWLSYDTIRENVLDRHPDMDEEDEVEILSEDDWCCIPYEDQDQYEAILDTLKTTQVELDRLTSKRKIVEW